MTPREIIARAWDAEESAQMGEPSPWVSADAEGDVQWKFDRLGCAAAVLDALDAAGYVVVERSLVRDMLTTEAESLSLDRAAHADEMESSHDA